jgi:hypothetical protein
MRTEKQLCPGISTVYTCELETCPGCGSQLERVGYLNGRKTVQTMTGVMQIGYYPKRCPAPGCGGEQSSLRSAEWQQVAPLYGTYGFDVIGNIGWQRQMMHQTYEEIQRDLVERVQISASEVRYLYTYSYLPLLACHERGNWEAVRRVSAERGLLLTMDGLAPEGGEPQLWLVRELRTGLTLRSGWMSEQGQTAFENFLRPIAEQGLRVEAVLSDKQRGLVPAIAVVFPEAEHAFCQSHYLRNIAEPVSEADEAMKVNLRQQIREVVGDLIRPEQVESAGVLTVTGLLPGSDRAEAAVETVAEPPVSEPVVCPEGETGQLEVARQARGEIETAFNRRVRYLLTLKGRPPFCLAGIEMYERLTDVSTCLSGMIAHTPTAGLTRLQQGLDQSLRMFRPDYLNLRQGADWLHRIADLLDPQDKPARTGEQVCRDIMAYIDEIKGQSQNNDVLTGFARQIEKTTLSYRTGLFHTYDIPDLPRTNNDRESEFRRLNQQLLRTTGQKGATRRLIQRSGAWELIPRPGSLTETIRVISIVKHNDYEKERTRVRSHRNRFRLHTRSVKHAQKQLHALKEQWLRLPPEVSSG